MKVKLPILMYHEIVSGTDASSDLGMMTPSYFIDKNKFREQLKILSDLNYKSLTLADIQKKNLFPKYQYVVVTFDDGWLGNFEIALPLLREFDTNAIVFVCTSLIGTNGYMDWNHIDQLVKAGISVQSHAFSHQPLETLSEKEIYNELYMSKKLIEEQTGQQVSAISFPHGSYNENIINAAHKIGYRMFFTSDVSCNFKCNAMNNYCVFGRFAVTGGISINKFIQMVQCDSLLLLRLSLLKKTKTMIRRLVGINKYRKIYRWYYKINDSSTR